MQRISLLLATLLCACLSGKAAAETPGVLFYLPVQEESYFYGCDADQLESWILAGASEWQFNIPETSVYIRIQDYFTDNPYTLDADFGDLLPSVSTVHLDTHGNCDGQVMEAYVSFAAQQERLDDLTWQYGDIFLSGSMDTPGGTVYIVATSLTAIETLYQPAMQQGTALSVTACLSCFTQNAWGTFSGGAHGNSLACYMVSPAISDVCQDLENLVGSMSCWFFDEAHGLVNNTHSAAVNHVYRERGGASSEMLLVGNNRNRWVDDPPKDCKPWAASFLDAGAAEGRLHWIVRGEQEFSYYLIYGRSSPQEAWQLVGTRDRLEEVDPSAARYHQFPDDVLGADGTLEDIASFREFKIVEVDNGYNRTSSEVFGWSAIANARPEAEQLLLDLPQQAADGRPFLRYDPQSDSMREWSPAEGNPRSGGTDPADVVVYTNAVHPHWGNRIWLQAATTLNPVTGENFRVTSYAGGPTPEDYLAVYAATVAANAEDPSYPQYPTLILVGRPDDELNPDGGVYYRWYLPDGEEGYGGPCINPACRSWLSYDYPLGKVHLIPAVTYDQVQLAAEAADDYNNGRFVDPQNGVAFFYGDAYDASEVPWFVEQFASAQALFGSTGPVQGVLRESEFLDLPIEERYAAMHAAGADVLNQPLEFVFFSGIDTGQPDFTRFLGGDPADWTRKQRVIGFGPACEIGFDSNPMYDDRRIRAMLFNDPDHTVFAGVFGQMNGGYAESHIRYSDALVAAYAAAPRGTPLSAIASEASLALGETDPDYGTGATFFGALVLKQEDAIVSAPEQEAEVLLPKLRVPAVVSGSAPVSVRYTLPDNAHVRLEVFDLSGRLIDELFVGSQSHGEQEISWEPRTSRGPLGSGVYFVRMVSHSGYKSRVATAKMVLLH